MLKKTRLDQIIRLIQDKGSVEISELCQLFDVTEMTARRDLDALATDGRIIRTHGGALISAEDALVEKPFNTRMTLNLNAKQAIAKIALEYIIDGTKLFFNSSSSVLCLVNLIDNSRRLMIATDTISIADELNKRAHVTVIQIGGELCKNTLSSSGYMAEAMLRQFHFDAAIVGIKAIDQQGDLYCSGMAERGIYEALFETTDRIIVLADSSKIGQQDFLKVCNLKSIDTLITDSNIPEEQLISFRDKGFNIRLAEIPK